MSRTSPYTSFLLLASLLTWLAPPAQAQPGDHHSADYSGDWNINLSEVLRLVQLYNVDEFSCLQGTDDGYTPIPGPHDCSNHDADYQPADWRFTLSEVMRVIQFYNSDTYHASPGSDDGFDAGSPPQEGQIDGDEDGEGPAEGEGAGGEGDGHGGEGEGDGDDTPVEGEGEGGVGLEGELEAEPDLETLQDYLFHNFHALDSNHDASLSEEELATIVESNFDALDRNGNGSIDRFELLPVEEPDGEDGEGITTDTPPVITLIGAETITISCGASFTDPGATAMDAEDGDLTSEVRSTARIVDTSVAGEYQVRYIVQDSGCNRTTAFRTLIVEDTVPPVIRLRGQAQVTMECNEYSERGATATDACGGTVAVEVDRSTLDESVAGTYTVVYTATDASGNTASVQRLVTITDTSPPAVHLYGGPIFLEVGQSYEELGALSRDACSPSGLPVDIDASGLDMTKPGNYVVHYSATDASGNTGTAQRQVIVFDANTPRVNVRIESDIHDYCDCGTLQIKSSPMALPPITEGEGSDEGQGETVSFFGSFPVGAEVRFFVPFDGDCYTYVYEQIDINGELIDFNGYSITLTLTENLNIHMTGESYCYEGEGGEGAIDGEGMVDGEGATEGESDGGTDGEPDGEPEGSPEGDDTEGSLEGEPDPEFPLPNHNENPFLRTATNPLSAFAIDVDTASYSYIRRVLRGGYSQRTLTPAIVRIEEMLNYFDYNYPLPEGDAPFSLYTETSEAPWTPGHRLLRLGLQGATLPEDQRPNSNIVFLMDVSGSMQGADRLDLAKQAMISLVEEFLDARDRLSIVTYASTASVRLASTQCTEANKPAIISSIAALTAGGSTAGGAGLTLAYQQAEANLVPGGVNRVILTSDGDFNVGVTSTTQLTAFVRGKADTGVFLTTLGLGIGNLRDELMESLADNGNGNYAYIDTVNEMRKVLHHEVKSTLITIAKDVKLQVQFNPEAVAWYRLLGYENRVLGDGGFDDDEVDGGEVGAGHSVTALYELVAPTAGTTAPAGAGWKSVSPTNGPCGVSGGETIAIVDLRYKSPEGTVSTLEHFLARDAGALFEESTENHQFAASVAAFGMLLRDSAYSGAATYDAIAEWALTGLLDDPFGLREEFIELVRVAEDRFTK